MSVAVETKPQGPLTSSAPGGGDRERKKKVQYAGPYRLLETVGTGGMATVKLAIDPKSGRKVAVKIVDKAKLANPREQVSMAREITIMKLLRHENVLRLYDIYETPETILMVLDYYPGGDLYHLITQDGALRPSVSRNLFTQLIKGVQFCHEHMVIHRDLKPENLLLNANHDQLVLSDFGLSTAMLGNRRFLQTRCGTVHYIAPEVAKGEKYIGMASDVWSCGVILFTMVSASLPFDGESPVDVLKKIARGDFRMPSYLPESLQHLLTRMLWPDPLERITTAQILQHPWLTATLTRPVSEPELAPVPETASVPSVVLTQELLDKHPMILRNLALLGWEEKELRNTLLSEEPDISKVFFGLLLEHRKKKDAPEAEKSKVVKNTVPVNAALRRRNRGNHSRSNSIGVAPAEPLVPSALMKAESVGTPSSPKHSLEAENDTTESVVAPPSKNPKLNRQIRRVAAPTGNRHRPYRPRSSTEDNGSHRQDVGRRATVGDGVAPRALWGIAPSRNPRAKIYRMESGKSITEIFDNLQHVFHGLEGAEMKTPGRKKKGMKVTASIRDAAGKKSKIKITVVEEKNGGSVVTFKNSDNSSKKEGFHTVMKALETELDG
eukprot:TRINITY_DN5793_c0_g1_i1.p1 TRINITY_DN5793_c0_g1~~TRINITY_DN5793_c0_g1_i1.p1  ORF type:complete len:640 (-),score=131.81 TRINITY_DN5793_c0_g1_i1:53-1879(-)